MSWDNVLLNINGVEDAHLLDALRLAFAMHAPKGVKGYIKSRKKGLVLLWYAGADKKAQPFPNELTADEVFPIVKSYLQSEEAGQVELLQWEKDINHDGSNGPGWRVYAEDWGHVDTHYAICAVKRVMIWYGK